MKPTWDNVLAILMTTPKLLVKSKRMISRVLRLWMSNCKVKCLRMQGMKIGKCIRIYGKLIIEGSASNITIGDDCAFNKYVLLEAGENIHIGNNVVFSASLRSIHLVLI